MTQWWIHHKEQLPILEGNDRAVLEDLTGCIPLLLRPLLEYAKKLFCDIKEDYLKHQDLVAVGANVREFAAEKWENKTSTQYSQ